MPSLQPRPCQSMENPAIISLLQETSGRDRRSKSGGFFKMFKLFPMLSTGCKMVALLGRPRKALLAGDATTGTLFGYRKGRVSLVIQEDPRFLPTFVIELPLLTNVLHKEMATGLVRIALESEARTHKKRLMEEFVWAVYCNGRKMGYSIRKKQRSEEEVYVMQLLRGVSMGAGVLPCPCEKDAVEGELTYMRARFERVVGSKDSEAYHMINPDGSDGPELSIFFVRM
ncbi:protein MIZU-KUSSEI 1 [Cinnamomum micranthum f. kanehirae]|uniref:Protein MIZU-KUSSEI 1 n=1 Tax=Cinnamomum micranthum f. kanehirae TaxID=337451 RepID=A0A3S3PGB8_9MAGN|nr:protein MIZU-KUSSEI 1 [Cinnamomum micranthum f. kanehirae]